MNDDQYLLANAYLDGELTDDERRIAEADPDVMSEVEVLRALTDELRSVEPPSDTARESAIAVAMAEFSAAHRAPKVSAAAPVVPHRLRPAWMSRSLGIAAAAVAVGLLGVVVVNSGLRGGDDDAGDPAAAELGTTEAFEATAEAAETESRSDELATAAVEDGASDVAGDASEEASDEMSDEMAAEMAEESETADDGGVNAADAPAERLRPVIDLDGPIETPDELGALGTTLLELQQLDTLPPTPNTSCPPVFNILGTGTLVQSGATSDIYVAVQVDDDLAIALAQDDCSVLLEGQLFPTGS